MIENLEPKAVWSIFEEITKVPRPSKHEELIRSWLVEFAKKHSLEYKEDSIGNVVIRKAATPGMESLPTIVLQSHMDMVCEKNSDVEFDFSKDPIQAVAENGWVHAVGTTLGADCGIGMAAALAVLVAPEVRHGAVEALFTVDEETGLTGANNLAEDMLTGRYLINLDSEDDGEIFIGCAGGVDTLAYFNYTSEPMIAGWKSFRIDIKGLKGGHSGDDINKGLANSNKLMTRFLWNAVRQFGIRLAHFDGGNLRNAIPREAYALIAVAPEKVQPMVEYFQRFGQQAMDEFKYTEPDIYLSINETEDELTSLIDVNTTERLLNALYSVASGVLAMSQAMPGMVETSTNLASVKMKNDKIEVVTSQRSSVESAKWDAAHMVESAFLAGGAEVKHSDGYPGWNPNPNSHLLDVTKKAHSDLFGREAAVKSIHAGLECGLFLEKYPQLEMVSFGPTLRGVHSPDERIEIETVDRFWKWLLRTLETI